MGHISCILDGGRGADIPNLPDRYVSTFYPASGPTSGSTCLILTSYRNRFYEIFKATHFVAALLFILFFFIHCDFRLTSWYVYRVLYVPQPEY